MDNAEKSSAGKTAQNRSSEDCNAANRSSEDSSAQNTRAAEAQNVRNQHARTAYGARADDVGGSAAAGAGTAGRGGLPDQVQTRTERLISCCCEPRILPILDLIR